MKTTVTVKGKVFRLMIDPDSIQKRIQEIAAQIDVDYAGKELVVLCVLKGSMPFAADLIRKLDVSVRLDFIRLSSYGSGTESSGKIQELVSTGQDLKNKYVLVVEDIVDSGLTLEYLRKDLASREVASAAIATLLFKPGNFKGNLPPEYKGFEIANEFVIGYGMDYAEEARQLDSIYQLAE
jgi:hypoxanthine phosphoribosyltransferase